MPGPPKKANPETLFEAYYNGGNRRTLVEVEAWSKENSVPNADGVSHMTLRRYAHEFDWHRRADEIDAETRSIRDRRMAQVIAQQRVREIEAIATLTTRFFRRLIPSTADAPNPAAIQPEDIEIGDFLNLCKTFELLTGGATSRIGAEDPSRVDEMARQIMVMDAKADRQQAEREQAALTAGNGGNDGST